MMIKKIMLLALISLSIFNASISAKEICDQFESEPVYFKSLYLQSKNLGKKICLDFGTKIDSDELLFEYKLFAETVLKSVSSKFKGQDFRHDLLIQMDHFIELAKKGVDKNKLPIFRVAPDDSGLDSTGLEFQFTDWDVLAVAEVESAKCKKPGLPTCKELLESLAVAINQYNEPYVKYSGEDFTKKVKLLKNHWDYYFEEARSQTLLDSILTTYMEKDYLSQDRLVSPMEKQWFLVHPSIVIENVRDAIDGEQDQVGLAIEWIGVNWWDEETSPIGYPFGVSIASIYSDRPGVDDVGHGLMFTFDNSISVGWADHGGDNGFYVTVDFLSLVSEKKGRWEDYKKEIRSLEFSE